MSEIIVFNTEAEDSAEAPKLDIKDAKAAGLLGVVVVGLVASAGAFQYTWGEFTELRNSRSADMVNETVVELSPYELDAPVYIAAATHSAAEH